MELEIVAELAVKAGRTTADCVGADIPRLSEAMPVACVRSAFVTESGAVVEAEGVAAGSVDTDAPPVSGDAGTKVAVVRPPSPLVTVVMIDCGCCG